MRPDLHCRERYKCLLQPHGMTPTAVPGPADPCSRTPTSSSPLGWIPGTTARTAGNLSPLIVRISSLTHTLQKGLTILFFRFRQWQEHLGYSRRQVRRVQRLAWRRFDRLVRGRYRCAGFKLCQRRFDQRPVDPPVNRGDNRWAISQAFFGSGGFVFFERLRWFLDW